MLTGKSLKVVVPLDPAELAAFAVPPTARVTLEVQVVGGPRVGPT